MSRTLSFVSEGCPKRVFRARLRCRAAQSETCVSQEVTGHSMAETPLKRLAVLWHKGRPSSKIRRNGFLAFLSNRVDTTCVDINMGTAKTGNPTALPTRVPRPAPCSHVQHHVPPKIMNQRQNDATEAEGVR